MNPMEYVQQGHGRYATTSSQDRDARGFGDYMMNVDHRYPSQQAAPPGLSYPRDQHVSALPSPYSTDHHWHQQSQHLRPRPHQTMNQIQFSEFGGLPSSGARGPFDAPQDVHLTMPPMPSSMSTAPLIPSMSSVAPNSWDAIWQPLPRPAAAEVPDRARLGITGEDFGFGDVMQGQRRMLFQPPPTGGSNQLASNQLASNQLAVPANPRSPFTNVNNNMDGANATDPAINEQNQTRSLLSLPGLSPTAPHFSIPAPSSVPMPPHRTRHRTLPTTSASAATSGSETSHPAVPSGVPYQSDPFTSASLVSSERRRPTSFRSRRFAASRQTASDPTTMDNDIGRSRAPIDGAASESSRSRSSGSGSTDAAVRQIQAARGAMSSKMVASKTTLQSLLSVNIGDLPDNERTCVICYNDYGVDTPEGLIEAPLRLPRCKHVFGDHCIKKWLGDSDSCPYCRDRLHSEPKHQGVAARTFLNMMRMRGLAIPPSTSIPPDLYMRFVENNLMDGDNVVDAGTRMSYMAGRRAAPEDPGENQRRTRPRHSHSHSHSHSISRSLASLDEEMLNPRVSIPSHVSPVREPTGESSSTPSRNGLFAPRATPARRQGGASVPALRPNDLAGSATFGVLPQSFFQNSPSAVISRSERQLGDAMSPVEGFAAGEPEARPRLPQFGFGRPPQDLARSRQTGDQAGSSAPYGDSWTQSRSRR